MWVLGGHRVGKNHQYHGIPPPLPNSARIVYIDVRKLRRCTVDSVPLHSFVWPTPDVREAKSIARTLWTNHFGWADVLVVHGRCFSLKESGSRSDQVLEHLLWHWDMLRRPCVLYRKGCSEIERRAPIPGWCGERHTVYRNFCQCNLVDGKTGLHDVFVRGADDGRGSRHPGSLRSNINWRGVRWPSVCNCLHLGVKTRIKD